MFYLILLINSIIVSEFFILLQRLFENKKLNYVNLYFIYDKVTFLNGVLITSTLHEH